MWTRRRLLQAGVALGISLLWPAFTYSPQSSLQAVRDALMALRRTGVVITGRRAIILHRPAALRQMLR